MGCVGLILIPMLVRHILMPVGLPEFMTSTPWTLGYSNSPIGRYNSPMAAHPPPPPSPLYFNLYSCEKVAQNPAVLRS